MSKVDYIWQIWGKKLFPLTQLLLIFDNCFSLVSQWTFLHILYFATKLNNVFFIGKIHFQTLIIYLEEFHLSIIFLRIPQMSKICAKKICWIHLEQNYFSQKFWGKKVFLLSYFFSLINILVPLSVDITFKFNYKNILLVEIILSTTLKNCFSMMIIK